MKLIDLLVQELPKRGGWPEGVDAVEQDSEGRLFEMDSDYCSDFKLKKCDDWIEDVVTRQQYESALAASQKQAWNGEGLPPVGVECEWLASGDHDWLPVTVLVYDGDGACLKPSDGSQPFFVGNVCGLRPLRTEAERAIDEMVRLSGVSIGAAKILYDAGYRKG